LSDPKRIVRDILYSLRVNFRQDHIITCYDNDKIRNFIIDFLIYPDIIININKNNKRDKILIKNGFKVYYFSKEFILTDPKYIKQRIRDILWFYGF